jgi:hypothetical protein
MHFICSTSAVRRKYGALAESVIAAVRRLGGMVDVSGQPPEQIQATIAKLTAGPVCLVGGYDLLPPFMRANPTAGTQDDDLEIPTDAPYGAKPGKLEEEYAPSRPVSRLPDSAVADADEFLTLLEYQRTVPAAPTPKGSFEEAASEFAGALRYVHDTIPGARPPRRLSPPNDLETKNLTASISGRGRVHILLHGANFDPDWGFLWGHSATTNAEWIRALGAQVFDLCDLRGAVVSFSSCYATMLDIAPAMSGARTSKNQVALACLAHGAKVVFGSTRANWIDTQAPFDGYGPALVAEIWRQLARGRKAADALMRAKAAYLKVALSGEPEDQPYALKTVLQAQCYGHPAAAL